jgi:hypothetical protein
MRVKLIAAIVGAIVLAGAIPAQASSKVRCDLLTIEASNRGQGIDAALTPHASVLRKPPFSAFDTFKLVSRNAYDLELGVPTALSLPAPMGGSLGFNSETAGRLDLTLTITRPQAAPVTVNGKASPGSPLFAAGFKSNGGTWIFGVICNRSGTIDH